MGPLHSGALHDGVGPTWVPEADSDGDKNSIFLRGCYDDSVGQQQCLTWNKHLILTVISVVLILIIRQNKLSKTIFC